MRRKIFCIVLAISIFLTVFAAACSQKTTDAGNRNDSGTSSATTGGSDNKNETTEGYTLPIVKEPITLVFLKRENSTPGSSFMNNRPLVWEEYEKKTGIKVKFEALPSNELKEVIQLRLAAKQNIPDVIEIPGTQDGTYLEKYYADGVIIALNNYIDKYATNIKSIFEKYPDYKKSLTLSDGSITGLGALRATKYEFQATGIRVDILKKLNLQMPKTPDELFNVAKAFKAYDINGNGKADEFGITGNGDQWKELGDAWGLHYVTGDGWTVRDGKVVYEPVTPEYQDFLRFLRKCVKEGIFPADWNTVDSKTNDARIINGQTGIMARMNALSSVYYLDPNGTMLKNFPDAEWSVIPPLDGPYGKGILTKEPVAQRWRTFVVTSANKYPGETVKWMDYAAFSEEGQTYNRFGVENMNYRIENGKIIRFTKEEQEKAMPEGAWSGSGYLPSVDTDESTEMGFAHIVALDHPKVQELRDLWKYIEEPFVPPIPSVNDGKKLASLLTDVKTQVDEMFFKFLNGDANIDTEWDNYVKRLNANGLDDVISIYQKGYDSLNK
ncbi:MAG TPA: extracellular solute-binding protein [Clostridiales bacterium]|nr:extracellular solute-binding protein [Clostridiales bacterium]